MPAAGSPMSLAIAAEEAAAVDVERRAGAGAVDYQAVHGDQRRAQAARSAGRRRVAPEAPPAPSPAAEPEYVGRSTQPAEPIGRARRVRGRRGRLHPRLDRAESGRRRHRPRRPAAAPCSSAARPTCTSPPAPGRRSGSTASCSQIEEYPVLTPPVIQRVHVRRDHPAAAGEVRGGARARLRLLGARPGPLPRQHLPAARLRRCGLPHHPVRDQEARGPRRPAVGRQLRDAAARLRPRHRPDRFRQVDDAGVAGRPGEPQRATTTS